MKKIRKSILASFTILCMCTEFFNIPELTGSRLPVMTSIAKAATTQRTKKDSVVTPVSNLNITDDTDTCTNISWNTANHTGTCLDCEKIYTDTTAPSMENASTTRSITSPDSITYTIILSGASDEIGSAEEIASGVPCYFVQKKDSDSIYQGDASFSPCSILVDEPGEYLCWCEDRAGNVSATQTITVAPVVATLDTVYTTYLCDSFDDLETRLQTPPAYNALYTLTLFEDGHLSNLDMNYIYDLYLNSHTLTVDNPITIDHSTRISAGDGVTENAPVTQAAIKCDSLLGYKAFIHIENCMDTSVIIDSTNIITNATCAIQNNINSNRININNSTIQGDSYGLVWTTAGNVTLSPGTKIIGNLYDIFCNQENGNLNEINLGSSALYNCSQSNWQSGLYTQHYTNSNGKGIEVREAPMTLKGIEVNDGCYGHVGPLKATIDLGGGTKQTDISYDWYEVGNDETTIAHNFFGDNSIYTSSLSVGEHEIYCVVNYRGGMYQIISKPQKVTVTKKSLTVDDLEFSNSSKFYKTYDGSTECSSVAVQIKKDVIGNASPITIESTAQYNDSQVTKATSISASTKAVEETNYRIPVLTLTHNASINKKEITPTLIGSVTKINDGKTTLTNVTQNNLAIKLNGVLSGNDVRAAADSYQFQSAGKGQGKIIIASGINIFGAHADNYSLTGTQAKACVGVIIDAAPVTATPTISVTPTVAPPTATFTATPVTMTPPTNTPIIPVTDTPPTKASTATPGTTTVSPSDNNNSDLDGDTDEDNDDWELETDETDETTEIEPSKTPNIMMTLAPTATSSSNYLTSQTTIAPDNTTWADDDWIDDGDDLFEQDDQKTSSTNNSNSSSLSSSPSSSNTMLDDDSDWEDEDWEYEEDSNSNAPKIGTILNANDGSVYKVTSRGKTVEFVAPKNNSVSYVEIPTSVKIEGITYKVTSIGKNAAKGLKRLQTLSLGSNIKDIKSSAFSQCKKLSLIIVSTTKISKKSVSNSAFKKNADKLTVILPKSRITMYKKIFKEKAKKVITKRE